MSAANSRAASGGRLASRMRCLRMRATGSLRAKSFSTSSRVASSITKRRCASRRKRKVSDDSSPAMTVSDWVGELADAAAWGPAHGWNSGADAGASVRAGCRSAFEPAGSWAGSVSSGLVPVQSHALPSSAASPSTRTRCDEPTAHPLLVARRGADASAEAGHAAH